MQLLHTHTHTHIYIQCFFCLDCRKLRITKMTRYAMHDEDEDGLFSDEEDMDLEQEEHEFERMVEETQVCLLSFFAFEHRNNC